MSIDLLKFLHVKNSVKYRSIIHWENSQRTCVKWQSINQSIPYYRFLICLCLLILLEHVKNMDLGTCSSLVFNFLFIPYYFRIQIKVHDDMYAMLLCDFTCTYMLFWKLWMVIEELLFQCLADDMCNLANLIMNNLQ